jgi:N-acetylmuramoyl-L-alanine amidase
MKIAFVIGHHEKSKGAYSEHLKISEWDFYNKVVENMESEITVFCHPTLKWYKDRIKATADKINKGGFDLVIAGHFNAADSDKANGCETLYYFESIKGRQYAQWFSEVVNDTTEIKLRNNGLKALVNKDDRGYLSVYLPKPPVILIEPFFGTNKSDCDKIKGARELACIIDNFIVQIK